MKTHLTMLLTGCLLAGCTAEPTTTDDAPTTAPADGRVSTASFDGNWMWLDREGTPLYRITIAQGDVVGLTLASPSARRIPFDRCRCAIDGVDGLQMIELLGMPDAAGQRTRHCFTFMEHPDRHHGVMGNMAEGHYFEELITSDDHPLPRLRMRPGTLVRR